MSEDNEQSHDSEQLELLTCDKCGGPVTDTEGLTEEDKQEFRELFDSEFKCDDCEDQEEVDLETDRAITKSLLDEINLVVAETEGLAEIIDEAVELMVIIEHIDEEREN